MDPNYTLDAVILRILWATNSLTRRVRDWCDNVKRDVQIERRNFVRWRAARRAGFKRWVNRNDGIANDPPLHIGSPVLVVPDSVILPTPPNGWRGDRRYTATRNAPQPPMPLLYKLATPRTK